MHSVVLFLQGHGKITDRNNNSQCLLGADAHQNTKLWQVVLLVVALSCSSALVQLYMVQVFYKKHVLLCKPFCEFLKNHVKSISSTVLKWRPWCWKLQP